MKIRAIAGLLILLALSTGCTTLGEVNVVENDALPNIMWVSITGALGTEGGVQQKTQCEYVRKPGTEQWHSKRCFTAAGAGTLQTSVPSTISAGAQIVTADMISDRKLDMVEIMAATSRANTKDAIEAQKEIAEGRNETAIEVTKNLPDGNTWNIISHSQSDSDSGSSAEIDAQVSIEESSNSGDDPFIY